MWAWGTLCIFIGSSEPGCLIACGQAVCGLLMAPCALCQPLTSSPDQSRVHAWMHQGQIMLQGSL